MAVGLTVGKTDLDNAAGNLAKSVDVVLTQVGQLKAWMDTQTDANLTALGYLPGEVATLRSAITDLDQLRQVYQGLATRTPAYDYRQFAKLLAGINVH
jgi:hypothetical protein